MLAGHGTGACSSCSARGLQGKTLGIVGLGQIGQATARRARAFGMQIVYSDRRRADVTVEAELDARFLEDLDELLADCGRRLAALPAQSPRRGT